MTGNLTSFSVQNLVDCDKVCDGCGGGYVHYAMDYIQEQGIMTEKDYPYTAWNQDCHVNNTSHLVKIQSHINIEEGHEINLMQAVATIGPISVAIHATDSFRYYITGNQI